MLDKVSVSDLRRKLSKICKKVMDEDSEIVVTKNNFSSLVLVSWKKYRALLETTALANPSFSERIRKAIKERKEGKLMTSEQIKKRLGLKK